MTKSINELKSQTIIKRVMSGKTDKELLQAFSKLSSTDLHHSDFSRQDIIKLWNSLQNTPNKVRYFTFAIVDNNHVLQKKIKEIYSHDKYAYILHDKDKSAERKHCHYYLEFKSPRSFKSIANDLEIPVTMLEKVYNKKSMLDYLTHENDSNKHHYDISEITANFDIEQEKKDDGIPDIIQEFDDYCKVRQGLMDMCEFIQKYAVCIVRHQFSQRMQIYERTFNSSCTGAGLSSRSEFAVPFPCSDVPKKVAFPKIDPNSIEALENGASYSILSETGNARKNNNKLPIDIKSIKRKEKHGY